MAEHDALARLVQALGRLPGVGLKSAQRMAYHLLQHDHASAREVSMALQQALQDVRHCLGCHTFSQTDWCPTCSDPTRLHHQLCVVENPADQAALERTGVYRGLYFVLMGKLNPIQGTGPHDIGVDLLLKRIDDPQHSTAVAEVILATNFTAEGEATAHMIAQTLKTRGLQVTRLARGVPIGSELEYVDLGTIAHALVDRR